MYTSDHVGCQEHRRAEVLGRQPLDGAILSDVRYWVWSEAPLQGWGKCRNSTHACSTLKQRPLTIARVLSKLNFSVRNLQALCCTHAGGSAFGFHPPLSSRWIIHIISNIIISSSYHYLSIFIIHLYPFSDHDSAPSWRCSQKFKDKTPLPRQSLSAFWSRIVQFTIQPSQPVL